MTPLLEVQNLSKSYPVGRKGLFGKRMMQVLREVSLSVQPGEVLGLVGESGSGKSTIGKAVLRLIEADSGTVRFDGQDLSTISHADLRRLRKDMQIIFQDPYASLDPRKTIRAVLSEALDTHKLHMGTARADRLTELMTMVGLSPAFLDRRPHEFSGGQRQRIGIARALAVEPKFIVCDEAVSALDVSIQAQVLNLLADLRAMTGISLLFISHDLSVVRYISDRVMVLYLGKVMEVGPADQIHFAPRHPYTAALISAEPSLKHESNRIRLTGEIPSPLTPPSGCVFRSRCPYALPACAETVPPLRDMGEGRLKACIRDDIL
ncbi:ABC transporter ATP-binding protein [Pseudotabrizicola alkalilacus]|uniref:ATP-binding cassette domain-containing protein n=1 Tax=Pseudotabrizicola alkalilacus TaxID=2305252 RepID=A0A411YWL3_9RHOB|nr:oligopeptide/dipeptide ABC transporter ATP-binding protein [Pseudotabrizicola alkalilacus]RGP35287.1 ATP-binding cassette domain-containing protein [Pseudotabrizicola alkalilacus]